MSDPLAVVAGGIQREAWREAGDTERAARAIFASPHRRAAWRDCGRDRRYSSIVPSSGRLVSITE